MVRSLPLASHHRTDTRAGLGGDRGAGDRYVLKKVSTFNAPDPARRFTDEARIVTHLLRRGVPVAVPVLADALRLPASALGG